MAVLGHHRPVAFSSSRNNLYFEGSLPLLKGHAMVTKKKIVTN